MKVFYEIDPDSLIPLEGQIQRKPFKTFGDVPHWIEKNPLVKCIAFVLKIGLVCVVINAFYLSPKLIQLSVKYQWKIFIFFTPEGGVQCLFKHTVGPYFWISSFGGNTVNYKGGYAYRIRNRMLYYSGM